MTHRYEKVVKVILNSIRYRDFHKQSLLYTQPINSLIQLCSTQLKIKNFTFFRLWNDLSFSTISAEPSLIKPYVLNKLWQYDLVAIPSLTQPIYSRLDAYPFAAKSIYLKNIQKYQAKNVIVIEHDLHTCKDSHCFLVDLETDEIAFQEIFRQLFDITLFFYKKYQERDFPEPKMFVPNTYSRPTQHYYYNKVNTLFSPYLSLKQHYHLTDRNLDYMHLITLGLASSEISSILKRSLRTVEQTIDNIRYNMNLKTRKELEAFLQVFYRSQVDGYLTENNPSTIMQQWRDSISKQKI